MSLQNYQSIIKILSRFSPCFLSQVCIKAQINRSHTISIAALYPLKMGPKSRKSSKAFKQGPHQRLQQHPPGPPVDEKKSTTDIVQSSLKATELLILAAVSSPVSQLALSPVYGSIPSSIYHQTLTVVTVLLAWALKSRIRPSILWHLLSLLPVLAFSIPTIQFFLFRYSSQLGAIYGPLLTEFLTYSPLVFTSVLGSAELFDAVDLSRYGEQVMNAVPAVASYAILSFSNQFSVSYIGANIGSNLILTRFGLQLVVSAFYAILLPSKIVLLIILPLLHTLTLNVHSPLPQTTAVLNSTLQAHNYSLVARQESLTGYISVLDNKEKGFRVMRCDHSLLGGEWLQQPKTSSSNLKEPVFAIFATLEAVRLVDCQSEETRIVVPDSQKYALVM